ncbi:hypothetical protein O181_065064 [Austropuccinia psidii MF-1]|uniref:PUM-HD domain-containing protein n=1 Tax=Austropuccinia psidii MF-1 TaxID=1389203 RepID=A0A9Q3EQR5_9BASI|nr:hypothetical protein [Austropuccinia psidii MF-1]
MAEDLSASMDALPPRRGIGLFGAGGDLSITKPSQTGHHSRTKSKTDFLDLADSTTRLGTSPEVNSRLEQKRAEHERQRAEQKRVFAAQMRALEAQHESEERELLGVAASAPTTPPRSDDDVDQIIIGASDPNRQRLYHDGGKFGNIGISKLSSFREFANNSKSVPASRRHSGQDKETLGLDKLGLGPDNPLSMSGSAKLAGRPTKSTTINNAAPSVTSFLFDDELETDLQHATFGGKYLQMNTDDDKFPILVRRDSFPGMLSASSAALDLAPLAQTPPRHVNLIRPTTTSRGTDWSPFDSPNTYRPTPLPHLPNETIDTDRKRLLAQPQVSLPSLHPDSRNSPVSERGASPRLARVTHLNGTSVSRTSSSLAGRKSSLVPVGASNGPTQPTPSVIVNAPISVTSQQDKKTSLIPTSAVDLHNVLGKNYSGKDFNPLRSSPLPLGSNTSDNGNFASATYGLNRNNPIDNSFGPYGSSSLGGTKTSSLGFGFESPEGYVNGLGPNSNNSQLYLGKARRDPETNRFANIRLEDIQGDMFGLCKDQHGCRFLQKKLEEGDPTHRDMIFSEIYPHFGELMTDAFGNYLSQKLLEYSTDDQRDLLIESISGELVSISLNMHGTRAVQKMIDFLSTQRQVQSLMLALNMNVVTLIKDLNGNHVIQKCLNHLPPEDNQFIYNAVAANCIEVATHRHGCCVLQRCIDHASESQRMQLVTEITYNSLTLVQDPFGNYVVQYVLDLNDSRFIEAIVRQFLGNVCALSMQKFSSNVVEKCIRVSDPAGRRALVEELSGRQILERLLRDSFANYVVQTALDYSDPAQRAQLVDNIRPILPMIRNTPYGKRIQSKIQRENLDSIRGGADGRLGSSFLSANHVVGGASTLPLVQHHHHNQLHPSSQSQLTSPGFTSPWSTSSLTGPIPVAYAGMSLGREHQTNAYASFM